MIRLTTILCLAALLAGCSYGRVNEEYGPEGALASRTYTSTQLGTTRQAQMNASQVDDGSVYDLSVGEEVKTDENFVEVVRYPLDTVLGMYGLSQARRSDAFAPISPNQFGNVQAQPITAEQQDVMNTRVREAVRLELARISAEHAAAEEAAMAAEAEAAAQAGGGE